MNLFDLSMIDNQNCPDREEITEALIPDRGIAIKKIISTGQVSPPGFWYNQDRDEWVALLQGKATLAFKDGRRLNMQSGDWLLIPAGDEHRVEKTSEKPPCIWLAVHGKMC